MMTTGRILGSIAAVALAMTAAAQAEARDLTVTSWGGSYQDAQRKVFFEPYTQETGVKLLEDSWDGGIGPLRAKAEGAPTWDLVQVEADELVLGCDEGIIEPIDYSQDRRRGRVPAGGRARMRRRRHRLGHGAGLRRRQAQGQPAAELGRLLRHQEDPGQAGAAQGPAAGARVRADGRRRAARPDLRYPGDARGRRSRLQEARRHQATISCSGRPAPSRRSSWARARW